LVREQRFRADLFARLDGCQFRLPALKARREDLGLMVSEVLRAQGAVPGIKLDSDAAVALLAHEWPHNVRELGQRLTRALVFAEDGSLTKRGLGLGSEPPQAEGFRGTDEIEAATGTNDLELRRDLVRALEANRGNISEVARSMGKARMQIQRWLKRFEIDPSTFRGRS
jgi:transcriptional regulator of acetoin/glycerol metabolism